METINLYLNGNPYEVKTQDLSPEYRLVDFIRNEAKLTGTKITCREGGCGACVVSVKSFNSVIQEQTITAVNSCLVPVLSCNGWNIVTVEGLGNKKDGLHPIQKRMVDFSASQCGFCTPGMVMSMHSLYDSQKQKVSSADVGKILDGNICRCTGYRPILDAFKSLATDASEEIKNRCKDMEDLGAFKCTFNCNACKSDCNGSTSTETISFGFSSGEAWIVPSSIPQLLEVLQKIQSKQTKYRLVAGNTGTGVFKEDGPYSSYVDLGNIAELKQWSVDSTGITIGSGVTISEAIEILNSKEAREVITFSDKVAKHMGRIANVPVRNRATLAGNLMLKHAHNEFPSDIFILLESLETKIKIATTGDDNPIICSILEFLNINMYGKIILSVCIPERTNAYFFSSYKITRRYQNAHAYVNAAFLFKLNRSSEKVKVVEKPKILFGGITNTFAHASATEAFLDTKDLSCSNTFREALEILNSEIQPDLRNDLEGTKNYRKLLPKSLFYKVYLQIIGDAVHPEFKSGGGDIPRLLSSGRPRYETAYKDNELYGAAPKLEAPAQATGQAEYVGDIPKQNRELVAVYVLTTVANAKIKTIDTREALRVPGVIDFVVASDVPGNNDAMPYGFSPIQIKEPIFVERDVSYAGQAIGLILAESREAAVAGKRKVVIEYEDIQKPLLDVEEAVNKADVAGKRESLMYGSYKSVQNEASVSVEGQVEVKGKLRFGAQAHFHMETQGCLCIPMEDGMTIYCGTQWIDHAVNTVAQAISISTNSINMVVRRIGGSFGSRVTRASGIIAAGAIAAAKVSRPVRLILDLESNLELVGKRNPYLINYSAKVDDLGRIQSLNAEFLCDNGFSGNEPESPAIPYFIQSTYRSQNWDISCGGVLTNTATCTSVRGPGSTPAVAAIEFIMEHIAHALNKDPLEVRLVNIASPTDLVFPTDRPFAEEILVVKLIDILKKSSEYDRRKVEVEAYNASNRWKKRGLALIPIRYPVMHQGLSYPVYVTISHYDGTVAVSHGGIEIGQGINTKVAQTVAYALKIPLDKVKVKPSDNFVGNNSSLTGGSVTSEACCEGALRACGILNERLDSVRKTMENKNPSWEEVVAALFASNQSLSALYMFGPLDGTEGYNVWITNATEVEVDILTGEYKVTRVDILEDTGKSISPAVDLGQLEGAYIMGQGLWTTEEVAYDEETGRLLTNRTWSYKVPESQDIPEDFRVTLYTSDSSQNQKGVLGTKATGEPPLNSGVCVVFALKNAIDSARRDAGNTEWYQIDGPVTPQDIVRYALTDSYQFNIW